MLTRCGENMQGHTTAIQAMKLADKEQKTVKATEKQQIGLPQAKSLKMKKECISIGHFGQKTSNRREFYVP